MTCSAKHSSGRTCHQTGPHEWHLAGYGDQRVEWRNADFEPPVRPTKVDPRVLGDLADRTHEGRRHFGGGTYVVAFDYERLNAQSRRVFDCMRDGEWRGLSEIAAVTGDPEASVSARLRDFRKPEFGALTVERQRVGDPRDGVFRYRLLSSEISSATLSDLGGPQHKG